MCGRAFWTALYIIIKKKVIVDNRRGPMEAEHIGLFSKEQNFH